MLVSEDPFTLTNEDGYEWEADPSEWDRIPGKFLVGDFVAYTMVTDTRVFEVVATTAKTVTIRPTKDGEVLKTDGASYPTVRREALSAPEYDTETVRLRKDGTYRVHGSAPLRQAERVGGKPVTKTDYSY